MSSPASLRALSALPALKESLIRYAATTQESLGQADQEIARTLAWLQERNAYWNHQAATRRQRFAQAQDALAACRSSKDRADCSGPARELAAAQAAVREAEAALEIMRVQTRQITEAAARYHKVARAFRTLLAERLPLARSYLEKRIAAVSAYTALGSESSGISPAAGTNPLGAFVKDHDQRMRLGEDVGDTTREFIELVAHELRDPGSTTADLASATNTAQVTAEAVVMHAAIVGAVMGGQIWNRFRGRE